MSARDPLPAPAHLGDPRAHAEACPPAAAEGEHAEPRDEAVTYTWVLPWLLAALGFLATLALLQ
jgi:hypothetical protein